MNQDNIIQKIRNLLKRSDENSGASLNERLTCAEIAQRLMNQHRISYEVAMSENGSRDEIFDYIKKFNRTFTNVYDPPSWIKALFNIISKANNCEIYLTNCADPNSDDKFVAFSIVGRSEDIAFVHDLCMRMMLEILIILGKENSSDLEWNQNFCLGAVSKLKEKLDASKKNVKVEGLSKEQVQNALVVIEKKYKEVLDYFQNNIETEDSTTIKSNDKQAFFKGYRSADKINPNKQKVINSKTFKTLQS